MDDLIVSKTTEAYDAESALPREGVESSWASKLPPTMENLGEIAKMLTSRSEKDRMEALDRLKHMDLKAFPHSVVWEVFDIASAMFASLDTNGAAANCKRDNTTSTLPTDALEVLYYIYGIIFEKLRDNPLFWRMIHFGLRQPDPFRMTRKYALSMFKHALKCTKVLEGAREGESTVDSSLGDKQWGLFITVYEALEDFPMYLLLDVWAKMTDITANCRVQADEAQLPHLRSVYNETTGLHNAANFPPHIPIPVFHAEHVDEVWLTVLLDRAFSHDNPVVRRGLLQRTLLLDLPVESKLPNDPTSVPVNTVETIPLGFRLPPWYVVSQSGLLRHLAEPTLCRGFEDPFGRALERYVFAYLKHLQKSNIEALPQCFSVLLSSLIVLVDSKAAVKRILAGIVKVSEEFRNCDFLDTTALFDLRTFLCALSHRNSRTFMTHRYMSCISLVTSLSKASTIGFSASMLFLASMPARLVLPVLAADAGPQPLSGIGTYEAVAAWLRNSWEQSAFADLYSSLLSEYISGGSTNILSAVSLARAFVCYPWVDANSACYSLHPIADVLRCCFTNTMMSKAVLARAMRFLQAIIFALTPASRNADVHLNPAFAVDALTPLGPSALHAEYLECLCKCAGGSQQLLAQPADDLYLQDADVTHYGFVDRSRGDAVIVDDVRRAQDYIESGVSCAVSTAEKHPALLSARSIVGAALMQNEVAAAELSSLLSLQLAEGEDCVINSGMALGILVGCCDLASNRPEFANSLQQMLENEEATLQHCLSGSMPIEDVQNRLIRCAQRLCITPYVRADYAKILSSLLKISPRKPSSDIQLSVPANKDVLLRDSGSQVPWQTFRDSTLYHTWSAIAACLSVLTRNGVKNEDISVVLEGAEAILSELDSATDTHLHVVCLAAQCVIPTLIQLEMMEDVARCVSATTLLESILRLCLLAQFRNDRRVVYQLLCCVFQPSVFFAVKDGKPQFYNLFAQVLQCYSEPSRPAWAIHLACCRFLTCFELGAARLQALEKHNLEDDRAACGEYNALLPVMFEYTTVLAFLATHREALQPGEDPALLDSAAKTQLQRWYEAHPEFRQKNVFTVENILEQPQKLDAAVHGQSAALPVRGAGSVTRIQALMCLDHLCDMATLQRFEGASSTIMKNVSAAKLLVRAVLLRLLRLNSTKAWATDAKPGSPGQLSKLRCWQAIAVICSKLGKISISPAAREADVGAVERDMNVFSDGDSIVIGEYNTRLPSLPPTTSSQSLSAASVFVPPAFIPAVEEISKEEFDAVACLPPEVIEQLFFHSTPGKSLEESRRAAKRGQNDKKVAKGSNGGISGSGTGGSGSGGAAVDPDYPINLIVESTNSTLFHSLQKLSDDVMASIVVHVAVNGVLTFLQLPPVKHYVEMSLAVLARRFPFQVYFGGCKPCLTSPNCKGQLAISCALVTADMTGYLSQLSSHITDAAATPRIHHLLRQVLYDAIPLTGGPVGILRAFVQTSMKSVGRVLFPRFSEGAVETPADSHEQLLYSILRYLHSNHELQALITKQEHHLRRINPDVATSLQALLCATPEEHGELMPYDVFADMKQSFSTLSSAMHLVDQYGWTTEECIPDEIMWGIRAGLITAHAKMDSRLSEGLESTYAGYRDSKDTSQTLREESFNFQRKFTSAVAISQNSIASSSGSVFASSLPPFIPDVAASNKTSTSTITNVDVVLNPRGNPLLSEITADGRRCQPIIILASLLTKATNLGGLARTSEIFAAESLVVPDLRVKDDAMFDDVSVSAGTWMTIHECPQNAMVSYIRARKAQGYTIVGLEQAARSQRLGEVVFPDKVVLVLGAELKGMPAEIIKELDICVEIPQFGLIRSLNVHVSASMLLWEYTRQRLAAVAAKSST